LISWNFDQCLLKLFGKSAGLVQKDTREREMKTDTKTKNPLQCRQLPSAAGWDARKLAPIIDPQHE